MKKCPKCKKLVNESEKKCPHCGHPFGYVRIKYGSGPKVRKRKNNIFLLMLTFFIASFLSFSYFFNEDYFNSLAGYITDEDFNQLNAGDQEYIDAIASFEKGLKDVLPKDATMTKSYSFGKDYTEYRYFNPVYMIEFHDNTSMKIELQYDLETDNDYVKINYSLGDYSDFESMVKVVEENQYFASIVTYIQPDTKIMEECATSFIELKDEFELKKDVLGNYGIHSSSKDSDSLCSYTISQSGTGYYLKLSWAGLFTDDIF